MPIAERAERNGRQGVRTPLQEAMTVLDPETHAAGAVGRRDDGRDHVPRQHHHEGLSEESGCDGKGVRRRLVPYRRPRGDAAGRLREDPRPLQGHHHLRRREHLVAGSGGGAVPPSRGAERRRGGAAGREMGRDAVRLRRTEAGRHGHRGRTAARSAASTWRASRCRRPSCSASFRRPRPARSRSSCCAKWRNPPAPSNRGLP